MTGRFDGTTAVVVGLGASGRAAADTLAAEGASVLVSEDRPSSELEGVDRMERAGIEVRAGGHDPSHLDGAEIVVASPGVPERAPVLEWARERGVPIWSELELGAQLCSAPFVAITGTNGKTTTTEMVAAAMRACGLDAVACGNIGLPFTIAAREGHDALAVEASSFQLRFVETFHPRVSVLLNVSADHLDWHGSLDAYGEAKARVFELQGPGDTHVGNRDDDAASRISERARCAKVWFRLGRPVKGEVGYEGEGLVAALGKGPVQMGRPSGEGRGFLADAAAAGAGAIAFGLDPATVGEGIRSVEPLPHRGRVVANVGGVRFVDDSKATNPHAALAALEGLHDVVLIAGGLSKGVDLSPLAGAAPSLKGAVVIGEAAAEIASLLEGTITVRKAGSIEEAVRLAFQMAPDPGTVLLAPACASQDMFRDYRERGDRFSAASLALTTETPRGNA